MSYLDLVQHLDDSADGGDDTEDLPPFNTTYIKEFIPENESLVVVELLDFLPTELSSKWPEVTPMPILGDGKPIFYKYSRCTKKIILKLIFFFSIFPK